MNKSAYNFTGRQRIFLALLCVGLLTGISFLMNYKTQAETDSKNLHSQKNNYALKSFRAQSKSFGAVNVGERASVWLKLEEGKPLDTTFYGGDAAVSALRGNLAEPTAQFSADINADGYADLISGFSNAAGGGLIALHRANRQAFEPTDEQVLADLKRGVFPASFEKDAIILKVPTAPDFIFAGRFARDSVLDLVFASQGGTSLFVMSSDGRGGFGAAREIALDGEITALASDSLDASKLYSGVIAAVRNGKSSNILVFDGADELARVSPRKFQIEGDINSLILANPAGGILEKDVFGTADGEIFALERAGSRTASIRKIETPLRAVDIAVGEFIRDRQGKAEIAVLSEDGNVSYLKRGSLDTRPYTTEEVIEYRKQMGRGRDVLSNKTTVDALSNDWSIAEQHQLGVYALGENSARTIQKAYITGNETEDVLILNRDAKRAQILFKEPTRGENRETYTGETLSQTVNFAGEPVNVLPMRLNVMGQQGFVFFGKGNLEPTTVMFVPNATFIVSKLNDTNDAVCNADCSVREAIQNANSSAGADMISFGVSGTHTLTLAGINEDNAGTGDLDIRESKTIVGNGFANTIIQAGASPGTGIDKVMSINPTFASAFATSFTGFTVQHGRNQSTFASGVGFGGGFDWEASGTGTLTITNLVVNLNTTQDGDGGGIAATSFPVNNAFVSITQTNILDNDPDRVGAASPIGGGLFVGTGTTYRLSSVNLVGNTVAGGNNSGQGGGIYAFGPASAAGKSFLTGATVSMNTAPSDGGGVLSLQPIDININPIISNNSSGRFGGGLFVNHGNGTTIISKAQMTNNSAATTGSAIYLGTATTANNLTMSFSRIVGNTGPGLDVVTVDGTATVENNWWGCNTGPSAAPCDTAGVTGGGLIDFNPWLQLRLTASPNTTPVVGESRSLTASFLLNSAGGAVAASDLNVLIGLPVAWSALGGTISGAQGTIQSSGTATATFTPTAASPPNRTATAQVDNGPATVNFTVGKANTTTTITGESADPTAQGEVFTVFYTVTVNSPGAGTPTGNVTVSDGANSCVGTVAAGQCNLFLNNVGVRTLTATYASDTNFNGSVSAGVPHTVVPIVAASVSVSGRVQTQTGRGIANARIILTDQNGEIVTAISNGFGYYRFEGIQVGQTYFFNVRHKEYQFAPQAVTINEDIADLNFTALE